MAECISHHHACECREALFADLVEAAQVAAESTSVIEQGMGREFMDRLSACLAQLEGRDALDVFTEGGA